MSWSARLRSLFDAFGEREWDRPNADGRSRAAFEVHRRFLARFVKPGQRALEIGAGPGRFTIELGRLGCRIMATDISPAQLELNAQHVAEAGLEEVVEERRELDVNDLSSIPDRSFDVVVAYGGPLSYAFDSAPEALGDMLRVVRPGGHVIGSVMDLPGTLRFFLGAVPQYAGAGLFEILRKVVASGDNRHDPTAHPCRMFTWAEIEAMAQGLPCEIVGASASNFLTCGDQDVVEAIEGDPELWGWLLDQEVSLCQEPGALDGGTHLLFALRRR